MIYDENNVLTEYELVIVRDFKNVKTSEHEHPHGGKVLNYVWKKDRENNKTSYGQSWEIRTW